MRPLHAVAVFGIITALAATAVLVAVRRMAPNRRAPAIDFAALAVTAAQRVESYGARHDGFRHLRPESVLVQLPPGTGLRVREDSLSAIVVILYDARLRCTIRVTRGEPLTQPRCIGGP